MKHQLKHHLATLAALTYLVAAAFWTLPDGVPGRHRVLTFLRPAFNFAGLWQGWSMFAPDPTDTDVYVEARVSLAGQAPRLLNLSHMSVMGYGERYSMERWRKFTNEAMLLHPALMAPAAERLARMVESDASVPVTGIDLLRAVREADIPGEGGDLQWHLETIYHAR